MSCNTGIYDRMTAREMVEYYGRLYGIPEEKLQTRIDEIFDVLQMKDIRDRLGGKMSTGMKQKVSIARTIVHDPPVIIFDEPTSGLDVLVARAVLQAVAALRTSGKGPQIVAMSAFLLAARAALAAAPSRPAASGAAPKPRPAAGTTPSRRK